MITTRFAPSPTGALHIGGLRTALYAYALAKHANGRFLLRIEDTDKKREVKGAKEEIKKLLTLFGLDWDGYSVQSERVKSGVYQKAAEKLVKGGHAYQDGGAIRLKVPKDEKVSFRDFVLDKEVQWETNSLTDLVLLKSDGFPTYHLAVVVDDHEMGVTHVLRGHDWLPSTPIHLLIYQYLGYKLPEIGHLTDILDPEGGKLSKRKGSTSVTGLLKEGYLPEAIANFIMLLGWAPKDNQEVFSLDDFVKEFDVKGFQKANPIFNKDKLDWFNGLYIRETSDKRLRDYLYDFYEGKFEKSLIAVVVPLVKDRIKKLSEFESLAGFFFERPKVNKKLFGKDFKKHLEAAILALKKGDSLEKVPGKSGFSVGDFFMDVRVAIAGSKVTPPINESIAILGRKETLKRLQKYGGKTAHSDIS